MKRSPELTPLSHDHHQALFAAHQLARGAEATVATAGFRSFWTEHGKRHFRIEEEILLPAWLDTDPEADFAMATRVLTEHLEIRKAARTLERAELSIDQLAGLGDLLQRHVRFEERELFPLIESRLSHATLAALGGEIAEAEGQAR